MSQETFHEFIRRVAMFKDFNDEEIDEILRIMNRIQVHPMQVIAKEGEIGDRMFLVREGVVQVKRILPGGREMILARLSSGMVIGEMSLMDDEPRSAHLVAESEGVLYAMRRRDLDDLKAEMHPAAYKLLRSIATICCERLREVNDQIQRYLDNPVKLFEPEIRHGMESATIKDRINRFLKIFG